MTDILSLWIRSRRRLPNIRASRGYRGNSRCKLLALTVNLKRLILQIQKCLQSLSFTASRFQCSIVNINRRISMPNALRTRQKLALIRSWFSKENYRVQLAQKYLNGLQSIRQNCAQIGNWREQDCLCIRLRRWINNRSMTNDYPYNKSPSCRFSLARSDF